MRWTCPFLILGLLSGGPTWGQESDLEPELARAIEQLGDDSFDVRQRAEDRLSAADDRALGFVEAALERATDAEVAVRLERIVLRLRLRRTGLTGLVFTRGNGQETELYLWEAGRETRLTDNDEMESYATWSPDGERIAYAAALDEARSALCVVSAGGGEARRLTPGDDRDVAPAWSPDGSRIAFMSKRGGDWDVHVVDSDGKNATRLTRRRGFDGRPAWSPDGRRIAFESERAGGGQVVVVDADGGNERQVTRVENATVSMFAWSPDGTRIGYIAGQGPYSWDLFVVDAEGGQPTRVTEKSYSHLAFCWTSDGKSVAYCTDTATGMRVPGAVLEKFLIVAAADGTGHRTLAEEANTLAPSASADGRSIVYVTESLEVRLVRLDPGQGEEAVLHLTDLSIGNGASSSSFRPACRWRTR